MFAAKQLVNQLITIIVLIAVLSTQVTAAPTLSWEIDDAELARRVPQFESNRTKTEQSSINISTVTPNGFTSNDDGQSVTENETSLAPVSEDYTSTTTPLNEDLVPTQSTPSDNSDIIVNPILGAVQQEPLSKLSMESSTTETSSIDFEPIKQTNSEIKEENLGPRNDFQLNNNDLKNPDIITNELTSEPEIVETTTEISIKSSTLKLRLEKNVNVENITNERKVEDLEQSAVSTLSSEPQPPINCNRFNLPVNDINEKSNTDSNEQGSETEGSTTSPAPEESTTLITMEAPNTTLTPEVESTPTTELNNVPIIKVPQSEEEIDQLSTTELPSSSLEVQPLNEQRLISTSFVVDDLSTTEGIETVSTITPQRMGFQRVVTHSPIIFPGSGVFDRIHPRRSATNSSEESSETPSSTSTLIEEFDKDIVITNPDQLDGLSTTQSPAEVDPVVETISPNHSEDSVAYQEHAALIAQPMYRHSSGNDVEVDTSLGDEALQPSPATLSEQQEIVTVPTNTSLLHVVSEDISTTIAPAISQMYLSSQASDSRSSNDKLNDAIHSVVRDLMPETTVQLGESSTNGFMENQWVSSDVDITGRNILSTISKPEETEEIHLANVTSIATESDSATTITPRMNPAEAETTTSGETFFENTPLAGLINRTSISSLDLTTVATLVEQNFAQSQLNPNQQPSIAEKCVFGGRQYSVGEHVEQTDPCHFCVCVNGGYLDCYWKNCPPAPEGCVALDFDNVCDRSLYVCPIPKKGEPLPFPVNSLPGSKRRRSANVEKLTCDILGVQYKVGEMVGVASDPCMECRCALDSLYCSGKCCFQPSAPNHDPSKHFRSNDVLWQPVMANPLKHLRFEFERHNSEFLKKK